MSIAIPSKQVPTDVKIDSEIIGTGSVATRGDTVTIAYDLKLNRGEVVQSSDEFTFELGSREVVALLNYGVEGMAVGGQRTFHAGPHLGYREFGIPGVIPPNAVLHFEVRLLKVARKST